MANETPDDERELRIAALMDYYGASDDEPSGVRLSDDALEQVRDAVREEINAGMDRAVWRAIVGLPAARDVTRLFSLTRALPWAYGGTHLSQRGGPRCATVRGEGCRC
jgi:hypothetical protein